MRNRWVVLAASVVTQTILGGIYAWSTFVPALIERYGLNNAGSSFIFGLTIGVFTVSMTFAGRLLKQKGPRLTANISAILYMTGYLIASVSGGDYLILLISLGLITGAGIGFGYVGPLSVGMKWFPDRKGLITGITVAGFGGGAVILSTVAGVFIDSGVDVLVFFRWMGFVLGAVLIIAAQCMFEPESDGR
ncbi:MAG: MFS transporter, partial [Sediminispirochaetaceae bacterium]